MRFDITKSNFLVDDLFEFFCSINFSSNIVFGALIFFVSVSQALHEKKTLICKLWLMMCIRLKCLKIRFKVNIFEDFFFAMNAIVIEVSEVNLFRIFEIEITSAHF